MLLVRDDDLERIDLGDGDWVDLKRSLSKGDRARIQGAAMRMQMRISGAMQVNGEQMFDEETLLAITFRALEVGIKRWSLGDLPITRENLEKLDERAYDRIVEESNRLWQPLAASEGNA